MEVIGYRTQDLTQDFLTTEMTITFEPEDETSQKTQPETQLLLKSLTSKEIGWYRIQRI